MWCRGLVDKMVIIVGMSKCVGVVCVCGIVVKEVILGCYWYFYIFVCMNFYGECLLCIFLVFGCFVFYFCGMIISCMLCGGL